MNHLANWIEIPATDLQRAAQFYRAVLDAEINEMQIGNTRYAIFRTEDLYNCGALACGAMHKPSQDGVVVYLDGGDDLAKILGRVNEAGGKARQQKIRHIVGLCPRPSQGINELPE